MTPKEASKLYSEKSLSFQTHDEYKTNSGKNKKTENINHKQEREKTIHDQKQSSLSEFMKKAFVFSFCSSNYQSMSVKHMNTNLQEETIYYEQNKEIVAFPSKIPTTSSKSIPLAKMSKQKSSNKSVKFNHEKQKSDVNGIDQSIKYHSSYIIPGNDCRNLSNLKSIVKNNDTNHDTCYFEQNNEIIALPSSKKSPTSAFSPVLLETLSQQKSSSENITKPKREKSEVNSANPDPQICNIYILPGYNCKNIKNKVEQEPKIKINYASRNNSKEDKTSKINLNFTQKEKQQNEQQPKQVSKDTSGKGNVHNEQQKPSITIACNKDKNNKDDVANKTDFRNKHPLFSPMNDKRKQEQKPKKKCNKKEPSCVKKQDNKNESSCEKKQHNIKEPSCAKKQRNKKKQKGKCSNSTNISPEKNSRNMKASTGAKVPPAGTTTTSTSATTAKKVSFGFKFKKIYNENNDLVDKCLYLTFSLPQIC